MDNLLTPRKISRLISLAEDNSSNNADRILVTQENLRRAVDQVNAMQIRTPNFRTALEMCETSSGILDLEKIEAFGDSQSLASLSLSKSTAFNPGEMTGRSTGATETSGSMMPPPSGPFDRDGLGGFISRMHQQTKEVNDVLRHSIASNYTFHSKPDLTADEASFIAREAPLPVAINAQAQFVENISANNTNVSVGTYFKNKCQDFKSILGHTESPDNTSINSNLNATNMMPSISEVSCSIPYEVNQMKQPKSVIDVDDTLDTVPVRQPATNARRAPEKSPRKSKLPPNQVLRKTFVPAEIPPTPERVPKIPEKPKRTQNPTVLTAHKSFMSSSKPADVVLKNLHSTLIPANDEHRPNDTEVSLDNSVSLSKIADYLGRSESEISISDFRKLNKMETKNQIKTTNNDEVKVTLLKDTKKTDSSSSVGTSSASSLLTVLEKLKVNVPTVIVTQPTPENSQDNEVIYIDDSVSHEPVRRSKSPSKSPTTLRDLSRPLGESPDISQGECSRSILPSPIVYKPSPVVYQPLDKSVDWQDVYQLKRLKQYGVEARMSIEAREGWADIIAHNVEGYVGVSCPATISVTTHTDSWLTAVLRFDELNNTSDINIDLSRVPLLLSPRKCESFNCQITANIEMVTALPFTVSLKDASVDGVIEQRGELPVKFVVPTIQAYSSDGVDKLVFPAIQETSTHTKCFVLVSDCPVDLKLKLCVAEGDSIFIIKSVQVININDIEKALTIEEQPGKKTKKHNVTTQLCGLAPGEAIKVTVVYTAPKLAELGVSESSATFNDLLAVNLIASDILLKKIQLVASVGVSDLVLNVQEDTVHINSEPTKLTLTNMGSALGSWTTKYISESLNLPFKITPSSFEIPSGGSKTLTLSYLGLNNSYAHATLKFKENTTGHTTSIDIVGGEKPKTFPIKTNHNVLSWVRPGRKEISLKNTTDKRVHIKCNINGEGFCLDSTDGQMNSVLTFEPRQCLTLVITFKTYTSLPCKATMNLVYDHECARKIKLFGCNSGESARWSGLMTYASTALVQAASRAPIQLQLYNKAHSPAFITARLKFNFQYLTAEASSYLVGAPRVIPGRARHVVTLHVDWARVERRRHDNTAAATELATVTIVTGAEHTRRRILRVLREESESGEPDLSLLPEYLRALAGPFEGEDNNMERLLEDFSETKESLTELMSGLYELTAHVELPPDISDEHTIIICDETMVNHHTLLPE